MSGAFYRLECIDCREQFGAMNTPAYVFQQMVSTTPGEILSFNFEQAKADAGESNADRYREFYDKHASHRLEEVKV
jgi:hypothetical protein